MPWPIFDFGFQSDLYGNRPARRRSARPEVPPSYVPTYGHPTVAPITPTSPSMRVEQRPMTLRGKIGAALQKPGTAEALAQLSQQLGQGAVSNDPWGSLVQGFASLPGLVMSSRATAGREQEESQRKAEEFDLQMEMNRRKLAYAEDDHNAALAAAADERQRREQENAGRARAAKALGFEDPGSLDVLKLLLGEKRSTEAVALGVANREDEQAHALELARLNAQNALTRAKVGASPAGNGRWMMAGNASTGYYAVNPATSEKKLMIPPGEATDGAILSAATRLAGIIASNYDPSQGERAAELGFETAQKWAEEVRKQQGQPQQPVPPGAAPSAAQPSPVAPSGSVDQLLSRAPASTRSRVQERVKQLRERGVPEDEIQKQLQAFLQQLR